MKNKIVSIKLNISNVLTEVPLTIRYKDDQIANDEYTSYIFEMNLDNNYVYTEETNSMELGIKDLQKKLPPDVKVVGCISCIHGNYNPYGDHENEMFCLKDKNIDSKEDLLDIFDYYGEMMEVRARALLYYCNDYKNISTKVKYSYNDWTD